MDDLLWQPSDKRKSQTNLTAFMRKVEAAHGVRLGDYGDIHRWSVDRLDRFWPALWDFCGIVASVRGERVIVDEDKMPGARFFPEARLNFAENLLRHRGGEPALIFRREDGLSRRLSRDELREMVSRVVLALRQAGIRSGDRVAGYLPNMPEAIVCKLAAASVGAVWSSCSPDFGVRGVIDRFGQIEPRVLFTVDGYKYAGKDLDQTAKLKEILTELPTVEHVVDHSVPARQAGACRHREGGRLGRFPVRARRRRHRLRAGAVRPPALHPLFVRHDRHAEMHRAQPGRRAPDERQGACAARRREAGRPGVLLHDARLDDVELADRRPDRWVDPAAVRRVAVPSRAGGVCGTSRATRA